MSPSRHAAILAVEGELFRSALRSLLLKKLKFRQVYTATSFKELEGFLLLYPQIDVAISNIRLLNGAGRDRVKLVQKIHPSLRIIAVSPTASPRDVYTFCTWGLDGLIPEMLPAAEIVGAVKTVLGGRSFFPSVQREHESQASPVFTGPPDTLPVPTPIDHRPTGLRPSCIVRIAAKNLSERQRLVFEHLVQGKSNKQIARSLGLAEGTIKVHIHAIYNALGVHNRAAAVATLVDAGATAQEAN